MKDREIKVTGHAGYAKRGSDIVCASVSTAIILSSNLLTRFDEQDTVEVVIKEGYFTLKVLEETKKNKAIIDNLIWTLDELLEQYPKYIKKEL